MEGNLYTIYKYLIYVSAARDDTNTGVLWGGLRQVGRALLINRGILDYNIIEGT